MKPGGSANDDDESISDFGVDFIDMSVLELCDEIEAAVNETRHGVKAVVKTKVKDLITHLREKFKAMESMEALGEKVKNLGDTVEKLKESVEGTDRVSYANVAARSEGNLRNQPGVVAGGFRQTQPRVDPPKTKFFRFYKSNETEEARAENKGEKLQEAHFEFHKGKIFDSLFQASEKENAEVRDFKFVKPAVKGIDMNGRNIFLDKFKAFFQKKNYIWGEMLPSKNLLKRIDTINSKYQMTSN